MKSPLNRFAAISAMLYFLTFALISCSKDTEFLTPPESVEEKITITPNTEQVQDSVPDSTVSDSTNVQDPVDDNSDDKITGKTVLTLSGKQFYINGKLTYEGRYWQGRKIEGLLMNSRMVQGIFDDSNPETRKQFAYPDTDKWSAERNTNEFIASMQEWKNNGLLAFTLNLQGGSPTGYGNAQPWVNSAFNAQGNLKQAYLNRLERILDKADELNMVVILGYFYFGQDQVLNNENAVIRAVDNITEWILDKGYENILVEINNECNHKSYDHNILRANRIHELIKRVKETTKNGKRLLVSTSFTGGNRPTPQVARESDYIILHGNAVKTPNQMRNLIRNTRNLDGAQNKPIIINEDDHFDFDKADYNFLASIDEYASWGYFDFRNQGEGFEEGFQSVPIDWGINSNRKRSFFNKLKEITGF